MKRALHNFAAAAVLAACANAFAAIEFKDAAARIQKAASPDLKAVETLRCAEAGLKSPEFVKLGLEVCAQAAKAPDVMTKIYALRALAALGDAAAVPVLVESLQDSDANVRIEALRALGMVGDENVLDVLIEAACSIDAAQNHTALSSIAAMRGAGVEAALLKFAFDEDEAADMRTAAIRALARRNTAGLVPRLLELARGNDLEICSAALQAVGETAGLESAPALLELAASSRPPSVCLAAADALAAVLRRAGAPEAETGKVLSAFDAASGNAKVALSAVLAAIASPKALEKVKPFLYDQAGDKADVEEKQTVIFERLARAEKPEALALLSQCIADMENGILDDAMWPAAENACLQVAVSVAKIAPDQAKAAMEKIIGTSKDKKLVKQAEAAVGMAWLPAF